MDLQSFLPKMSKLSKLSLENLNGRLKKFEKGKKPEDMPRVGLISRKHL